MINLKNKTADWTPVIPINFMWATQVPVIRMIGSSLGPVTVQPDMSGCGELTEAKKIASLAADSNMLCVPHAFKTGALVAASIHFIASVPHASFLEFSVTEPAIRNQLLAEPFTPKDGYMGVPTKAGPDIDLNTQVIKKYGVHN